MALKRKGKSTNSDKVKDFRYEQTTRKNNPPAGINYQLRNGILEMRTYHFFIPILWRKLVTAELASSGWGVGPTTIASIWMSSWLFPNLNS